MNQIVRFILFIFPGTFLIFFSLLMGWVILPTVIKGRIEERAKLVKGSESWETWVEIPIPLYLKFYIHHVTNPAEVEDGLKPIFQEKGPYVYREKRKKVDIRQNEGPNTVKYKCVTTYHFDKKLSGKNRENDLVNVLNIPFVAVLHTVGKQFPIDIAVGLVGNLVLFRENLIRTGVSVKEFLFEGFDVTRYTNSLLGNRLPEEFSGGRFGLYKGKNGTASEEWEIYTGYDNPDNYGKIKSWNGKTELGLWKKYSKCDKVTGTDGSLFSPFITKQSILEVFSPDICSSLPMRYVKDIEYRGISGYQFQTKTTSGNGDVRERNNCFCLETDPDKCPLVGSISLEPCRKAPVYSSLPYFLNSDVRLLAQSGLANPDKEKHLGFLEIEPTTGIVLRAHKRVQISFKVTTNRKVRALQSLTQESIIFPVVWADESAELTDEYVSKLKSSLVTPLKIINIGKWVGLGLGVLSFLIGLAVFIYKPVLSHQDAVDKAKTAWKNNGTPIASESTLQKKIPNLNGDQGKHEESQRNRPRRSQILPSSSSSSTTTMSTVSNEILSDSNAQRRY